MALLLVRHPTAASYWPCQMGCGDLVALVGGS